jgi:hypothetical protein
MATLCKDTGLFFADDDGASFGLDVDVFLKTAEFDEAPPKPAMPAEDPAPTKQRNKKQSAPTAVIEEEKSEEELRAERHKRLQRIFLALDREEQGKRKAKQTTKGNTQKRARPPTLLQGSKAGGSSQISVMPPPLRANNTDSQQTNQPQYHF